MNRLELENIKILVNEYDVDSQIFSIMVELFTIIIWE